MDGRSRFRQVMRGEAVDRPPYWEVMGFAPAALARWQAEGLPADDYPEASLALDRIDLMPIDDGLVPDFTEEAHRLATRADLAAIQRRLNPASPRRYPRHWTDFLRGMRERDWPAGVAVRGPFGRLVELAGTDRAAALLADDPALARDALEVFAQFIIDLLRPTLAGVPDIEFLLLREAVPGRVLTAAMAAEWWAPLCERLVRVAGQHGVKTVLVICPGDMREALPSLLDAGVTGIGPLSAEAGMDPVALRREYGSGLVLLGGIDGRALTGDRAAVEREVMQKAPALLAAPGWVPSIDQPVPAEAPLANYRYYWELVRDLAEAG